LPRSYQEGKRTHAVEPSDAAVNFLDDSSIVDCIIRQ
jgi:hypothetical protein